MLESLSNHNNVVRLKDLDILEMALVEACQISAMH